MGKDFKKVEETMKTHLKELESLQKQLSFETKGTNVGRLLTQDGEALIKLRLKFIDLESNLEIINPIIQKGTDLNQEREKLMKSRHHLGGKEKKCIEQELARLRKKISKRKACLKKHVKVGNKIKKIEKDPNFLSDDDLKRFQTLKQEAKMQIDNTQQLMSKDDVERLQEVHQEAKKDLECTVCLTVKKDIYSCSQHHLLCKFCYIQGLLISCPVCRECFEKHPPTRNRTAERMAQTLCPNTVAEDVSDNSVEWINSDDSDEIFLAQSPGNTTPVSYGSPVLSSPVSSFGSSFGSPAGSPYSLPFSSPVSSPAGSHYSSPSGSPFGSSEVSSPDVSLDDSDDYIG